MKREGLRGFTVSHSNFHGGSSATGHAWAYNNGNKISSSEVRQVHIDSLSYEPVGPRMGYYCPNCDHRLTKITVRDTQHTSYYDTLPHPHDSDDDLTFAHKSFLGMNRSIHGHVLETDSCEPAVPNSIIEPLVKNTEQRGNKMVEILKGIVYGGLTESVTSLAIVTSAASAHAETLSIVALALANLIGGLFTMGHSLWELKNDLSYSEETGCELGYQYQEKLGKKQNFMLHITVAILSFLVFGLVPPIVYGFSFRQSDDRDLKIAAVGIASLACITLLAVAKASIQRPQKYTKTVAYYIALGFGVSVLSYAAGDLVNKLLEHLGWFHSAGASNTLLLSLHPAGMGTVKPSRQSY